jgi:hypothetical protein
MALENVAEAGISQELEDQGDLAVVEGRAGALQQNQAMQTILEIGKTAGRIQAAEIFANVSDAIRVGQLRSLKESYKSAGLTWAEACGIVGISTQRADQVLRLCNSLGEDFIANSERLGLSFRTLEAARQLPEPIRQALTSGDVVDLEAITKDQLTQVIKDLSHEHAKDKRVVEEALAEEAKRASRAETKAKKATAKAEELAEELAAQLEGLPAEDKRALGLVLDAERAVVSHLARIKNTLDLAGRSPAFIGRLQSSLSMIEATARYTNFVVQARAEGQEPNEDTLGHEARLLNADLAEHDERQPYPGI